jgi:hypothetical protein
MDRALWRTRIAWIGNIGLTVACGNLEPSEPVGGEAVDGDRAAAASAVGAARKRGPRNDGGAPDSGVADGGAVDGGGAGNDAEATGGFITRAGGHLYERDRVFHFAGANMRWIVSGEDNASPCTFVDAARIDQTLHAAQQMGLKVIRSWSGTVGVNSCPVMSGIGTFNVGPLAALDYAIFRAKAYGLRLFVSLIDHYDANGSYGGVPAFIAMEGALCNGYAGEACFFQDPTVIGHFGQLVSFILNHVNSYTKVAYKDDPTIMAWETGNELWCQGGCPNQMGVEDDWTVAVAAHIKGIAPRQLVASGMGINDELSLSAHPKSLASPNVDILDEHAYKGQGSFASIASLTTRVASWGSAAAQQGKVVVWGEYDWGWATSTSLGGWTAGEVVGFLNAVQSASASAGTGGDMLWQMYAKRDDGSIQSYDNGAALWGDFYFPAPYSPYQVGINYSGTDVTAHIVNHAAYMNSH